jgi:8-oxo-dGTP diphosphatase
MSTSVLRMAAQIPLAVAALVRDGLVLPVHRHASRRRCPDCWDLVGGHVEPDELPRQAVTRECLEELGGRIHDPRSIPMTTSRSTTTFAGSGPASSPT